MNQPLPDSSAASFDLHHAALVIDTHVDTPQRFLDPSPDHPATSWDFTGPLHGGHLSLDTARQGNLAAAFFALWPEPTQWRGQYVQRTHALLDGVLHQIQQHSEVLALCTSPADILAARSQHKFAILLGIEGGHALENSLANLRLFHQRGVRYLTLTWSNSNDWAESSGDLRNPASSTPPGLTPFGRDIIRELNRLGIIIDVSHASDATLVDVLRTTTAPILATHSSARALTDSPRNLTDDQLRAIAANRGAVMVNFFPAFIDEAWRQAWINQRPQRSLAHQALAEDYAARNQPIPFSASNHIDRTFAALIPRAPFTSLIAHIDHVARTAGIDHVGLGSDFDGIPATPEGIDSAADLPKITAALAARGYSDSDLHKLLGGNLLRVFQQVQSIAQPQP